MSQLEVGDILYNTGTKYMWVPFEEPVGSAQKSMVRNGHTGRWHVAECEFTDLDATDVQCGNIKGLLDILHGRLSNES